MRHSKKYREKCSQRGKLGAKVRENDRLVAAMGHRPTGSYSVFELWTLNPRTGLKHHLEIKHEIDNGNGKYNVYLDDERWRNNWSRTRFVGWLFRQIDCVVNL